MEALNKTTFETLNEQFQKIKVIQKTDKIGTETEPAWDANEAKVLIESMLTNLESLMVSLDPNDSAYFRLLGMRCAVIYEQAKIFVHIGDEAQAYEALAKALDLVRDHALKPEITFLALRVVNHYSYLLSKQGELDKPKKMLEHAESIYKELKSQNSASPEFYTGDDLFLPEETLTAKKENAEKVERIVTNNLQMLGFIFSKQGRHDMFAVYHHEVLRRQLEMKEGDPTMWAIRAARLASYFLSKSRFSEARHHLAAASYVLEEYEAEMKLAESSEAVAARWEELQRRIADVALCWVKYGLFLFSVSKTRLLSLFYGEPNQFLENMWVSPFDVFPPGDQEQVEGEQLWNQEKSDVDSTPEPPDEVIPLEPSLTQVSEEVEVAAEQPQTSSQPEESQETQASKETQESQETPETQESHETQVEEPKLDVQQDNLHILFAKEEAAKDTESADEGEPAVVAPEATFDQGDGVQEAAAELSFPSLDLAAFERQVTASLVETTEQARALFLFTHAWLKRSKVFYSLRDHSMEYVNAILDLSELYRYLAFYEEDIESQYSVQKRRADALETLSAVLREVRPQCYLAVSVELLRELAEVQLEMMGLNLRRLYVAQGGSPAAPSTSTPGGSQQGQSSTMQHPDLTLHKMEALADIHSRLEQFGDSLCQGTALGDMLAEGAASTGDALPYYV